MGRRLELHKELLNFITNVYYQPPSDLKMNYPCIVYSKNDKQRESANDRIYLSKQGYDLTVIETNPDSEVSDLIESYFQYCSIQQYYTVDNLNHTKLNLFY